MIRRDRNHPSVIVWSLGNEEWGIEGNVKGARIAATMQAFAQRLDPTRRTTVAISGGWGGISTVIDVMGYNYINHGQHRPAARQVPQPAGHGHRGDDAPGAPAASTSTTAHTRTWPPC